MLLEIPEQIVANYVHYEMHILLLTQSAIKTFICINI